MIYAIASRQLKNGPMSAIERETGMEGLVSAILEGDCTMSTSHARALQAYGVTAEQIVVQGIEKAMVALDAKCTVEEFNLLEIMLAGRAVTEVMKVLFAGSETGAPSSIRPGSKTVIVASLEGDVHELGKNIFKTVLGASGYRVVDCGKDCSLAKLMQDAEKEQPIAIGISGLITPVIPALRQIKAMLALRGLEHVKVIAGGAALKQSLPERLNVDFVADSAFDGLHYLDTVSGAPQP